MRRVTGVILCAFLIMTTVYAKGDDSVGILYQISGGKNPVTILGSIHVGTEEMYPFGKAVQNAIQQADIFVFECDTTSLAAMLLVQDAMYYHLPDSLPLHLSDEGWAMVECFAAEKKVPLSALKKAKPWTIVSSYTTQVAAQLMDVEDASALITLGVENQVMKLLGNRPCLYLQETAEQLASLNAMSDSLQEDLLRELIDVLLGKAQPEGMDAAMAQWPLWWRSGDADAFARSYQGAKGAEYSEEYRRLMMTQRNERMAARLVDMLQSGEEHNFLVTVGLMHLVLEDDSILTLLRNIGYTVEQVK